MSYLYKATHQKYLSTFSINSFLIPSISVIAQYFIINLSFDLLYITPYLSDMPHGSEHSRCNIGWSNQHSDDKSPVRSCAQRHRHWHSQDGHDTLCWTDIGTYVLIVRAHRTYQLHVLVVCAYCICLLYMLIGHTHYSAICQSFTMM